MIGDVEVVAEAADGREAVSLAQAHRPDVALLDIRMPRLDGLEAAEETVRAVPGTAVAMGAAFLSPKVARHVIDGFGAQRLGREAAARADAARRRVPRSPHVNGRRCWAWWARAPRTPEIARRLHLVEGTVKAYVSAVLDRLEVRNGVQAASVACEAGLV
ncbi:response regulator transcription factor [Streptomyces sp. NPDC056721]|uniref:response regulator transcription factor n=1 Tax=Streptomyces sp. NPDC056721 TaxID=3345923 RepID=UPI00368135A7